MQRFQKLLKWLALFLAGCCILLLTLAVTFGDKVKEFVVTEINKSLLVEVEVDKIGFSFLSNFPYASVTFHKVKVPEAEPFQTSGQMLSAEKVTLLFSPLNIISGKYELKKIRLSSANFNLQVDDSGKTNYTVWKSRSDSASSEFSLKMNEVILDDVDVLYYNTSNSQDHSFVIKSGTLSGEFFMSEFTVSTASELYVERFMVNGTNYIPGKDCVLDLEINVNSDSDLYTFGRSELQIQGLVAGVTGTVFGKDKQGAEVDLTINSEGADIPSLASVLPDEIISWSENFKYSGTVDFECRITGQASRTVTPVFSINFKTFDTSINPTGTPYKVTRLNATGFFTNRKSGTSPVEYLELSSFSAVLEGKPIKGSVSVLDFDRPLVDISSTAEIDLEAFSKFYLPDTLEYLKGTAHTNFRFKGIAGERTTYNSSGEIRLEDVKFKLKLKPLEFRTDSGMLHLDGNDIMINNLHSGIGTSDMRVTGKFTNLIDWLAGGGAKLMVNARLDSDFIDLDEILSKDEKMSGNDTAFRFTLSEDVAMNVQVAIDSFAFRKFRATDIKGDVHLNNRRLQTRSLSFNTAMGSSRLTGMITDLPGDSLRIDYDALVDDLNIRNLFYEMGNFGQSVITDNNINGRVTATVLFRSMWSRDLTVNSKSIFVKSSFTIEDGELIGFTPLLQLEKFLKGSDLKRISFSTLTNTIEIKDEKIFIPLMEINSSALDLKATGVHRFDNIVDYQLRLYLSQLMGKKVKEKNSEFGTIEEDGYGRPMIFLTMKGPVNDPIFKYDRKGVEQKITEDIKKEAKTLKEVIKAEFSKKGTPEEKKEKGPGEQEELEIEWEEDE
jgi:hypothetical protein